MTVLEESFRQFTKSVDDFGRVHLPEQFVVFQKKIALEVFVRVVRRTPVDTGRARGGWQISIDNIPSEETGSTSAPGENEALSALAGLGQNQTVFISNNVPYILFLEEGSSTQAPNGMLALALQDVEMAFGGK